MSTYRAVTLVAGLCGVALIAAVASVPAVSAGVVTPQVSGAAGSLDPSFAGGAGYRAIPIPDSALEGPRRDRDGLKVLVNSGGELRTIVTYPIREVYGGDDHHMVMRGWTVSGWVDRSFYSGKAKLITTQDPNDGPGLTHARSAAKQSTSLSLYGYIYTTYLRLQADGRQIARRDEADKDDGTYRGGHDFLPSGAPVVCWTMADERSTRLQLFDAGLLQVGYRDGVRLPGHCRGAFIDGSHLWYLGSRYSSADGAYTLGIARTDLALNPDPAWGQDGYVEMLLPFYPTALLGMADGGAYVWSNYTDKGEVWIAKLTPAGDWDTAFGTDGVARFGGTSGVLSNRAFEVNEMAADTKGVVMAVRVRDLAGTEPWRYRLIRVGPDGSLDPLFGKAGIVTTSQEATSLALDAQGRILTLSTVSTGSPYLARRLG